MADETTQQKKTDAREDRVHVHVETDDEYEESGPRAQARYVADQFRTFTQDMVDGVLKCVPPEVVEHVNNSRKEMLLAFRELIDRRLSKIDKTTRHAWDLHKEKEPEETGPADV